MSWKKMGTAFISGIPDPAIATELNASLENLMIKNEGDPWNEFKRIVQNKAKQLQEIALYKEIKFGKNSEKPKKSEKPETPKLGITVPGNPEVNILVEGGKLVKKFTKEGDVYFTFKKLGKSSEDYEKDRKKKFDDDQCYNCGKWGHFSQNCQDKKSRDSDGNSEKSDSSQNSRSDSHSDKSSDG